MAPPVEGKKAYEDEKGATDQAFDWVDEKTGGYLGKGVKELKNCNENWKLSLAIGIISLIAFTILNIYGIGAIPVSPTQIYDYNMFIAFAVHALPFVGIYFLINALDKWAEQKRKAMIEKGEKPSKGLINLCRAARVAKAAFVILAPMAAIAFVGMLVASPWALPPHSITYNVKHAVSLYSFDAQGHIAAFHPDVLPYNRGFNDFTFSKTYNDIALSIGKQSIYFFGGIVLIGLIASVTPDIYNLVGEYSREIDEINNSEKEADHKKKELELERLESALQVDATNEQEKQLRVEREQMLHQQQASAGLSGNGGGRSGPKVEDLGSGHDPNYRGPQPLVEEPPEVHAAQAQAGLRGDAASRGGPTVEGAGSGSHSAMDEVD